MHNNVGIAARGVGEVGINRYVESVVLALLVRGASANKVLGTLHSLGKQSLHTLAQLHILHLADRALEAAAAGGVDVVAEAVHPLHKQGQTARVGGRLATQECLFGHSGDQLPGNVEVGLATEFLHKLVSRGRVEDVVLNRNILIIKLLKETQAWDIGRTVAEAGITELVRNSLKTSLLVECLTEYGKKQKRLTFSN